MAILGYKNSTQIIRALGLAAWLEARGLAGWLEIATDGLEAPARQRIAREIEAHYAEAVSAHVEAGEAESSAQATALAELGDPQLAGLSFQKRYLTESEAKSIQRMERAAARPLFCFRMLPLDCIPVAGLALLFSQPRWVPQPPLGSHFLAVVMLVAHVGFRFVPRLLFARRRPRAAFLGELAFSYLITGTALALVIASIPYLQDCGLFGATDAAFMVFIYGYWCNPGFQIWNKLRKLGDQGDEAPPCQTTIS